MARDDENLEHPAMRNFNEPLEYVKHVVGKALKWAAIGALVGGAVFAFLPGMIAAPLAGALSIFSTKAAGVVAAGGIGAPFLAGATAIGGAAAVIGAMLGFSEAGDAVADKREEAILAHEKNEVRRARLRSVEQKLDEQRLAVQERLDGMRASVAGVPMMRGQGTQIPS